MLCAKNWVISMLSVFNDLATGDLIAIQYRSLNAEGGGSAIVERWLHALINDCEPDTWPLARLIDGQLTEVRPYMRCQMVRRGNSPPSLIPSRHDGDFH